MHLPFHPEERKQQQQEKSVERKQKRQAEKEEEDKAKRQQDDLFRVQKQKKYDGWYQDALERLAQQEPDKYNMVKGNKK
jgi:hypothetical protein